MAAERVGKCLEQLLKLSLRKDRAQSFQVIKGIKIRRGKFHSRAQGFLGGPELAFRNLHSGQKDAGGGIVGISLQVLRG